MTSSVGVLASRILENMNFTSKSKRSITKFTNLGMKMEEYMIYFIVLLQRLSDDMHGADESSESPNLIPQ